MSKIPVLGRLPNEYGFRVAESNMNYKTIEIEKRNPSYAALNPDTGKIYISYETSNLILIINTRTGEIESKISANYPADIEIAATGDKIYVTAQFHLGGCFTEIICLNFFLFS